ncbi:MAG: hypothetical protein M1837_001883 [Sclerophora amabilis]|nr:MAG: hypothetical protein M1837_001883 [Sclerophora amabilis]
MADTAASTPKKAKSAAASQATGSTKKAASSKKPGNPGRHVEEAQSEAGGTDAGDATNGVTENGASEADGLGEAADDVEEEADGTAEDVGDEAEGAGEEAEGAAEEAEGAAEEAEGAGEDVEGAADDAEGAADDAAEQAEGGAEDAAGDTQDAIAAGEIDKDGNVVDEQGNVIGKLSEGDAAKLGGSTVDQEGDVLDEEGNVLGKATLGGAQDAAGDAADAAAGKAGEAGEAADEAAGEAQSDVNKIPEHEGQLTVKENGDIVDATDKLIGTLKEGDAKSLAGKEIKDVDLEGNLLGPDGTILGKMDIPGAEEPLDYTLLQGKKCNKAGKIVDENGDVFGTLVEGDPKVCAGKACDEEGKIWNDSGKVLGEAKPLPTKDLEPLIPQPFEDFPGALVDKSGNVTYEGEVVGKVVEGEVKKLAGKEVDADGDISDKNGNTIGKAERLPEEEEEVLDYSILEGQKCNKAGKIVDGNGDVIGTLVEGDIQKCLGRTCDEDGKIWNDSGKEVGQAKPLPESERQPSIHKPFEDFPGATVDHDGNVVYEGTTVGKVIEGEIKIVEGKEVDADGDINDKNGNTVGRAERIEEEAPPEIDYSILENQKCNKAGKIVDGNGDVIGTLVEGDAQKCAGRSCDAEGKIWNDSGKVMGRGEPLPESERQPAVARPFEDFPGATVDHDGNVVFQGTTVGKVVEGEIKKVEGKEVDADGDINDKNGNVVGKAERLEEEAPPEIDYSPLEGKKVNKQGNVTDDKGRVIGRVIEGNLKTLVGKTVAKEGKLWSDSGKVIGQTKPLSEDELEPEGDGPFSDFPDALVEKNGDVTYEGQVIGKVVEGDPKKLVGKKVDDEGDIVDKVGNVLGKAERWEEEEAPAVDNSALSGKRVNKLGNVVDEHGGLYGRVVEGDPKKLVGKMCDKEGKIFDEAGNVLGRAEVVPDSERTGAKEGPFSAFETAVVRKDGFIVDATDKIIGKLVSGDPKQLEGHHVDEDGEIIDKNGNSIGKAERYEEEEKPKDRHVCAGFKVNREGFVVNSEGETIGKLTEGDLGHCRGKEIDDDGDVVDQKGNSVGHVTPIEDVKPEKTPEEIAAEEEAARLAEEEAKAKEEEEKIKEEEAQLANRMSTVIEGTIEKIKPVLNSINDALDKAEKTPKEERDEEKLVKTVKPLIEEGGRILSDCNATIRGMDPDGSIQARAKQRAGTKDATPEEARLAELLKQLTGDVAQAIERAKKRLNDMPYAKKKLNPLWALLSEPLGQILAAVGLLLSGVLGLVGKLLGGLGLGGLVNNLLGGLGISNILDGLGVNIGGLLGG